MNVISNQSKQFSLRLQHQLAEYRHRVFIDTLGWDLPAQDGRELDQFDREDTVYVLARDAEQRVVGCARLLPTTRPYLLGEVFPELLNGMAAPCDRTVWELSRFAAIDFNQQPGTSLGQFSSPAAIRLLHASIACAASLGAARLITVSPVGVERLLRKAGFRARRAGPPNTVKRNQLFACWIDTNQTVQ